MLLSKQILSALFLSLLLVLSSAPGRSWADGTCCGPAGNAVDGLLSVPAEITAGLAGTHQKECAASAGNFCTSHSSECGPVGRVVEWALRLPGAVLGSLSGMPCHADSGSYRFPAGCTSCACPGSMLDIAPSHTVEDSPPYVTYGVVERRTVRQVPPVVSFSRPFRFDN